MNAEEEKSNGNPLQYSCLENPLDRGTWWGAVHGVTESDTTEVTQHARMHECRNEVRTAYQARYRA